MTDTVAVQERIGELCHQFKLPTVGVLFRALHELTGNRDESDPDGVPETHFYAERLRH